ncbi:MAG TPA: Sua5/YciO/YrdC/YwlC family protein [Xanthomonadales bacterium]|nr:Sua5/YciO/YrdC/YwlC family protein [Xanthomonadales bacterium]
MLNTREAALQMQAGAVVAYPTEAVYGLGCDPANEQAVRRLLALKQRSPDAGLILVADRFEYFTPFIGEVEQDKLQLALDSWPGPVTWLFPRADSVPDWLAGKHPAIALRLTAHPVCRELCSAFGGAIVSTSANPTTRPAPKSAAEVAGYFPHGLAGIVEGELGGRDQPSEIRDLLTGKVLRGG